MKLPHVTIEYKEEQTDALGKMSPSMIVGFGLHWSWVYLAMYSGGNLFRIDESMYRTMFFIASLVVFAATLLSYGLFLNWFRARFATARQRNRNRVIAASAMSTSVAISAMASFLPIATPVFGALAGVLSGVGSAVLLMSFGVSFSVCDVAESTVSTAFAFVVAALAFAAIVAVDDIAHPLGIVACAALPFVEVACLSNCSRKTVDTLEFFTYTIPVRTVPFSIRVCLPCVVFGVVLGFIRGSAFMAGTELVSLDGALTICLASVAACAFILAAMLSQRKTSYFMFRTLMPIAAVLLALATTPLAQDGVFLAFSAYAICFMLDASMWVSLSDVSQRYRVSVFTVFGFGRAALALGTIIAIFAIPVEMAVVMPTSSEATSLAIGALVLMILGYALLPTGMEVRGTLSRGKTCPAFVNEDDLSPEGIWGGKLEADYRGPSAFGSSEAPDELSDRDAGAKEEAHESGRRGHDGGIGASEDALSPERMGRFKRKCAAVADTFLLSRKETEVLFLLAKGRNSSAIQELLFISAGTANTHMRNIYRKLNVHSQQELIALVESMDETER